MQEADVAAVLRDTFIVVLKLGGPPLLVALGVGIVVSLLQSVLQVNEATLAYVPKLLALGATIAVLGHFMTGTLTAYTHGLFDQLVAVGGE